MSAAPELAPVRAGEEQDWPAIEAFLRSAVPDLPAGPMEVMQFPRGHANLTFLLRFGALRLVLRRPPAGRTAPGAHDMSREFRVLSRLWQPFPRAPRAYALCDDLSVTGARFVVQEYRGDGVVIFGEPPADMAALPDLGRRLTVALVDALADLHQVDYVAAGLADFGNPAGYLERQLKGWRDRWSRVATPENAAGMDALADRLEHGMPTSTRSAIVHNDFKLDNCQFAPGDPDCVISLFDWDMATIGDPLVDVGIALDYWHYTCANPALNVPPKEEFARLYAARMGIDVASLRWYQAFGAWRTGIATQQLYKRYADGNTADTRYAHLGAVVPTLAERGLAALAGRAA